MGKTTATQEEKRYGKHLTYLLTEGLGYLIDQQGGDIQGVSMRLGVGDCLLVVRAEFNERAMVAFVGGFSAAGAFVTLHERLREGKLEWRADKFRENGGQS